MTKENEVKLYPASVISMKFNLHELQGGETFVKKSDYEENIKKIIELKNLYKDKLAGLIK